MKVSDILRLKGKVLHSAKPDQLLAEAVRTMAELDIGSLVVLDDGNLSGILTFREVIAFVASHPDGLGAARVEEVLDRQPLTCTPTTEIDDVRRMMLERHARYMPVLEQQRLLGVISFYDVARAMVESQDYENRMLKAYISDVPVDHQSGSVL